MINEEIITFCTIDWKLRLAVVTFQVTKQNPLKIKVLEKLLQIKMKRNHGFNRSNFELQKFKRRFVAQKFHFSVRVDSKISVKRTEN